MRSYSSHTDEELFSFLGEDDTEAFNELYSRYWKTLYKYIHSCVNDEELTKDLLQNVFITLWNKRTTLMINSSLNDYIFRTTKNVVFKHFRSAKVHKKYTAYFTQTMAVYDNSNEEQQRMRDLEASIETSISQLPDHYQKAFRLSRFEHIPNEEIAKRMNISKRAVENYISTALKHLRGSLEEVMVLVWWLVT